MFGLAAALLAIEAAALGLGPATVSSGLGEPLRMSIPVTLQADEEIGCVQVRPHGDDLPSVFNTRSQVLRSGNQTRIEIRSPAAVDEPAVGLVVSVGCASPVARDYVLFLDPPAVAAVAAVDEAAPVVAAAARRASTPRPRPATDAAPRRATAPSDASASAAATPDRPLASPRPARRHAQAAPPADAPSPRPKAAAAASTRARPATGGDRLSVVPTEPPVVGRTSPSPQPGVFPPPVTDAALAAARAAALSSGAGPSTPFVSGTGPGVPAGPAAGRPAATGADAATETPPPSTDADAQAREEVLRQQQVALQAQIKNLSDQIAALRVQATSLAVRNQALEDTVFSPTLVWLLIALAVLAIAAAGWMAWRYTQLRRSLEGSAWWTGQTERGDDGLTEAPMTARTGHAGARASPSTARTAARPQAGASASADLRVPTAQTATASSAQVSNIDRIRPAVRAPGSAYPAAMDTDFTVSDIEAAMATVRTVSPPRVAKSGDPLEDSDFSGLAGATITSPFSDKPPQAPAASVPDDAGDEAAHFVDLDLVPGQPFIAAPPVAQPPTPSPRPSAPPSFDTPLTFEARTPTANPAPLADAVADLPFSLDFPGAFDPLATDSMKTTVIERAEPDDRPTELDFELPSQTQILAMTTFERTATVPPVRHGATALNDLFAPLDGQTKDTVLDLDDRRGAPLSRTEVDRLTSPLGPAATGADAFAGLSERARLASFADLLARVDDMAIADPLAAIAELRHYVLRDERIPTLLWLRLFELYKVVDKRPVYDALAEHFARRYHRPMVGWTQTLADRTPQRPLSALVEIDRQVESQWGTEAGVMHLETLLCDRTQDDAIVFNAVLQADLLDAAKVFPEPGDTGAGDAGPATASGPR